MLAVQGSTLKTRVYFVLPSFEHSAETRGAAAEQAPDEAPARRDATARAGRLAAAHRPGALAAVSCRAAGGTALS